MTPVTKIKVTTPIFRTKWSIQTKLVRLMDSLFKLGREKTQDKHTHKLFYSLKNKNFRTALGYLFIAHSLFMAIGLAGPLLKDLQLQGLQHFVLHLQDFL